MKKASYIITTYHSKDNGIVYRIQNGYIFELEREVFGVGKNQSGKWVVTDLRTGALVSPCPCNTRAEAVDAITTNPDILNNVQRVHAFNKITLKNNKEKITIDPEIAQNIPKSIQQAYNLEIEKNPSDKYLKIAHDALYSPTNMEGVVEEVKENS